MTVITNINQDPKSKWVNGIRQDGYGTIINGNDPLSIIRNGITTIGNRFIKWVMGLPDDDATFTRALEVNLFAYENTGPSASSSPLLLEFPIGFQAIKGCRIVRDYVGMIGDSFVQKGAQTKSQYYINKNSFVNCDDNGGVGGDTLEDIAVRLPAYISGAGYSHCIIVGSINNILGWNSDQSDAAIAVVDGMADVCVAEGTIPMLTTSPPFKNHDDYTPDRMTWSINYDVKIKALGAAKGYPVYDQKNTLSDDGETLKAIWDSTDGLHPNSPDGYNGMGTGILATGAFTSGISTDDENGNTLHPYTLKSTPTGTEKVFTEYPTYAVSTASSAGVQVAIRTSANNWVYMQSSGGTSDSTAVVIADTDIGGAVVADNDINWSVLGYATLHQGGQVFEKEAANVIIEIRDLSSATWTKGGTCAVAQDITGADGVANSGWTISGLDTAGSGFLSQGRSGLAVDTRYEPSLVLSQISATGVIYILNVFGATTIGRWEIDLSKLNTYREVVDRNHPAVTINTEFKTDGTGRISLDMKKLSGTGTLSIGYHSCNMELGEHSTSQIFSTVGIITRPATVFSDTVSGKISEEKGAFDIIYTPEATGNNGTYLLTSIKALGTDELRLFITPTAVILRKVVSSASEDATESFTHTAGVPMRVQGWWDFTADNTSADKMAVRAFSVGDAEPAFHTNTDTADMPLGTTFQIGSRNGVGHTDGHYIVSELDLDKYKLGL